MIFGGESVETSQW